MMDKQNKMFTILMADDDQDDCLLVKDAFAESGRNVDWRFVGDGVTLLEYLLRQGSYRDRASAPVPDLILLDLNMPRKDGREALKELKAVSHLRRIPIVVLSTSNDKEDVSFSYDHGATSFISKPQTFQDLVTVMKSLGDYWLETVELPAEPRRDVS